MPALFYIMKNRRIINTMNNRKASMAYRDDMGYSVIPTNGKTPAVKFKEYQERHATDAELESWFANTRHSIALVTGRLSNVTVLDADTPEADAWIAENANTDQIVRTPSGGHHYYFEFKEYPNKVNLFGIGLDVRSEGGIAVLPPSSGYEWVKTGKAGVIGDILPEIETVKREMPTYNAPIEKLIERTRSYISRIPGSISGKSGHAQAYKVACKIADRLSHVMTPEEALPLMEEWNIKSEPPWSQKELLHKLEDSWRR